MIKVFKTLIFSSFLVVLASCGQDYDEQDVERSRVGESLNIIDRNLREEEKQIALRICDGFRAKWTEFRMSKLNQNFSFLYQRTTCDNETRVINPLNTTLRRILDSQPLIFDSAEMEDTMQFMESHLHGHLGNLCQALQSGRNYTITETKGDKKIQFSFQTKNSQQDQFTVFTTTPTDAGFLINAQESFTVLTKPQASAQEFRGMVVDSKRIKSCATGAVVTQAVFVQSFLFPN